MKLFKKIIRTPEERKQIRNDRLLALASGILFGFSFPPFPFPYTIFIALIPYFYLITKRETLAEINRITYLTAFVYTLITLYWVGSWTKEADPFLMISGVLLMFVNPAVYLIPSTLFYLAGRFLNKKTALYLFPFFWVSFEYAYSLTDLRFPWLTLSNSLPKFNLFIQSADIIGAYGVSLLVLYINLLLFRSIQNYRAEKKLNVKLLVITILLIIVPVLYGIIRVSTFKMPEEKIKVGLVQPDLNPWDKWEAGNVSQQLDLYLDLSRQAVKKNAKLIIWPESALPVYLLIGNYFPEVSRIHNFADSNDVFVLTGMPDASYFFDKEKAPPDAKLSKVIDMYYVSYNSILLFTPQSREIQKYGKMKLVPFGEKVPFVESLPFLGDLIKWQVGISSWNEGRQQVVFDLIEGVQLKVGGVICIESIYPDFVAGFVQKGANLLAVVTNDSWYGYSSGPFQHKEISVLRAIENRRYVVRAANGGISAIIDPLGRTVANTKLFQRDMLVGEVALNNSLTLYSRFPLAVPLSASLVSIFVIFYSTIKKISNKLNKQK
ncbi:MAG TPA: apolipoprotein N-acyltransferase [Melioribacteraceae bacterium]|nr:apolipoprotein N-acyltransferase [Melioribacteraceae bacterium]